MKKCRIILVMNFHVCIVSTSQARTAPFATMTAARAPSPPRSVGVAVISGSQLALTWMGPESNGGSNVTRYWRLF